MATDATSGTIQSRTEFKDTPEGQYNFWSTEVKSSDKNLREFRKQGGKIVTKFKGGTAHRNAGEGSAAKGFRLNLYHSNAITLQSMLYGKLPKIDVSRRQADPNDDIGRVAAEIIERILTSDVEENSETYNSVLRACLQDRLLPGLGVGRCRYDLKTSQRQLEGVMDEQGEPVWKEQIDSETADLEYFHWRDMAWGWGRTFADIPWIGFRSYVDKDEATERWGEGVANELSYENQSVETEKDTASETDEDGPWQKAAVWELWDKKKKQVVWVCIGYPKVLETMDDFLGLRGFYPCPPFLLANQTTSLYVPVADYYMAQDLYNEIDTLQSRIAIITEAVKVVGVYDASAEGLKRMFKEGTDNDLIPVDNWSLFAEKGGIKGQIDWVPMKDIVNALKELRSLRDEQIGLLQQVTGMSDIMRGEQGNPYEGVGQSKMKAKFGSVRVQALQDEFASFASNLVSIKAEIIGRHFEPETIAKLANVESFQEADRELIPQAIQLIKNPDESRLRVEIRPESVAMVDYGELKAERTQYMTAIGSFMQAAQPIMEGDPAAKPFMLQLLQWGLAGFKGASEIEGVIDKAVQATQEAADKAAQNPKPDPEQQSAEQAMALEKVKHQNTMEQIQAKAQADMQVRTQDLEADIRKIHAESQANLQEIQAKVQADAQSEQLTSQINAEQQRFATEGEMEKEILNHQNKIEEIRAAHAAKMAQTVTTHDTKMEQIDQSAALKPEEKSND